MSTEEEKKEKCLKSLEKIREFKTKGEKKLSKEFKIEPPLDLSKLKEFDREDAQLDLLKAKGGKIPENLDFLSDDR